jgi:hypothetical protein
MALSLAARQHRRDLAELARLAESDLAIVFRQFDAAEAVRDGLRDILPRLMQVYGSAAITLAADWYDDLRDEAEVPGSFRAIPADLPDEGRTDALARWAVTPLFAANPSPEIALSKATGGLQRIIYNADRDTVTTSSIQDRRARGWRREGSGDCDLCKLLLGRGAVYSEATSQFETHDRCACVGVPDFG